MEFCRLAMATLSQIKRSIQNADILLLLSKEAYYNFNTASLTCTLLNINVNNYVYNVNCYAVTMLHYVKIVTIFFLQKMQCFPKKNQRIHTHLLKYSFNQSLLMFCLVFICMLKFFSYAHVQHIVNDSHKDKT